MKRVAIYSIFSLLIFACNNESNVNTNSESSLAAGSQSEEELKRTLEEFEKEEKAQKELELSSSTTLKFDKLRHDFGNVKPDSENTCKFLVTNTGKNPLIIENVAASCGCTTPHKPEKPIAPGKSDYIEVGFHPKPGQVNEIIKTVTVTANTDPKISEISIRAFVK